VVFFVVEFVVGRDDNEVRRSPFLRMMVRVDPTSRLPAFSFFIRKTSAYYTVKKRDNIDENTRK